MCLALLSFAAALALAAPALADDHGHNRIAMHHPVPSQCKPHQRFCGGRCIPLRQMCRAEPHHH